MTKIFFDTEFTGLHQNTTLISIGLISDCGKTFYGEFGDFDYNQINKWLEENVLKNLIFHGKEGKGWCNSGTQRALESDSCTEVYGHSQCIKESLQEWFSQFDKIDMWSDCVFTCVSALPF